VQAQLYRWAEAEGARELVQDSSYHGHILALFAAAQGDFVLVGDLMKSATLLRYNALDGPHTATERGGRTTAVEMLDAETFIVAENSNNLVVLRKGDGATDEERSRLDTVAEMHLGEFVNRFRHGAPSPSGGAL
jgi:DNA damage-binding protein 1